MTRITTILVVEDERLVQELISLYLEKESFKVITAWDGQEALDRVRTSQPDLILLDLMLPKIDGLSVCKEVRKTSSIPIIMLTSKGEELDRVLGLELGADDYITKPFSPKEMLARVKAVLRRSASNEQPSSNILRYPGLTLDFDAHRVELNGQELQMSPKEFDLLWFLAKHPGRVFSREKLLENVWDYDYYGDPRTVDTHVKRLREKLDTGSGLRYVKTVWGTGYKFEVS